MRNIKAVHKGGDVDLGLEPGLIVTRISESTEHFRVYNSLAHISYLSEGIIDVTTALAIGGLCCYQS